MCLWASHFTSENLSLSTCKMGVALEPVLRTWQGCGDRQREWYNVSVGQTVILSCLSLCLFSCTSKTVAAHRTGYILSTTIQFYLLINRSTLGWHLDCWMCWPRSLVHLYEKGLLCSKLWLLKLICAHESLRMLIICRFWFSRSEVGLGILHFPQTPRSYPCCWCDDHTSSSENLGNMVSFLGVLLMLCSACIYLFQV